MKKTKLQYQMLIAPTGIEADALATALCVLDGKKGRTLIDLQGKNWASFVVTHTESGTTRYESKNYSLFRLPQNP